MKKIMVIALVTFMFLITSTWAAPPKRDMSRFFHALHMVEGGGRLKPTDGDGGKAIGPYQIWFVYWKDSGVSGSYQQCRDKAYAERVMIGYWKRYCPQALATGDWQTLARTHNGGLNGPRKAATLRYWKRVQRVMLEGN